MADQTLNALNTQTGFGYQWVLCIQGYEYLLTDGPVADALTAWTGVYSQGLGGLSVSGDFDHSIDAFETFSSSRSLSFQVVDCDGTDRFGIDVARIEYGAKCFLVSDLEADDLSMTVTDTSDFTSSGDLYVNNERMTYSAKTTTSFTLTDRAVYDVLANGAGRAHYVSDSASHVQIRPVVSQYPRSWLGRRVALYMHRVYFTTTGSAQTRVLDTDDEALLVFAGKITDIRDSANGVTSVACVDVIEEMRDSVVLKEQWEAEIDDGFEITDYDKMKIDIYIEGTGLVSTGFVSLGTGWKTLPQLISAINSVGVGALRTARSTARFGAKLIETSVGPRVQFSARDTATGSKKVAFIPYFSMRVAQALGLQAPNAETWAENQTATYGSMIPSFTTGSSITVYGVAANEPLRYAIFPAKAISKKDSASVWSSMAKFRSSKGRYFDNTNYLPSGLKPPINVSNWGFFELAGARFLARKDGSYLKDIRSLSFQNVDGKNAEHVLMTGFIPYRLKREQIHIRQIVLLEGSLITLLMRVLTSTGAASNNGSYDVLPWYLGLGIPSAVVSSLARSLARIEGATLGGALVLIIDRPLTFRELINADMILRRAFFAWYNGSIRAFTWSSPRGQTGIRLLDEETKAGEYGDPQRSVAERSDRNMRNVIKVEFNRTLATEKYESTFTLLDAPSAQTYGDRAVTIKARNSFGEYAATGDSVNNLIPPMLAALPMFSRPQSYMRRTIDHTHFERLHPGTIVLVSDNFARDIETGERGITSAPAMVQRIRYDFGGFDAGSTSIRNPFGEVDLILMGGSTDVHGDMGYSALIDKDASTGGFTSGYDSVNFKIRTVANEYTASGAAKDASYFNVGDIVSVFEMDVASGGLSWTGLEITAISDTDITLDAALTGYTSGKLYKVVSDIYSVATSVQRDEQIYLADGTDLLIEDLRLPYVFDDDDPDEDYQDLSAAAAVVRGGKIDNIGDEGMPACVAGQDEIMRALDHLIDYCTNARVGATLYKKQSGDDLAFYAPIYVGTFSPCGAAETYLRVKALVWARKDSITDVYDIQCVISQTPPVAKIELAPGGAKGPVFREPCVAVSVAYDGPTNSLTDGLYEIDFGDIRIDRVIHDAPDGVLYVSLFHDLNEYAAWTPATGYDIYYYGLTECRLIERG